jgi:hypothetical protein
VDWEWGVDELQVVYDPRKVTPEKILETVAGEGFKGKVIRGPAKAAAP